MNNRAVAGIFTDSFAVSDQLFLSLIGVVCTISASDEESLSSFGKKVLIFSSIMKMMM